MDILVLETVLVSFDDKTSKHKINVRTVATGDEAACSARFNVSPTNRWRKIPTSTKV